MVGVGGRGGGGGGRDALTEMEISDVHSNGGNSLIACHVFKLRACVLNICGASFIFVRTKMKAQPPFPAALWGLPTRATATASPERRS